jgi:hypothetical protein
VAGLRTAIITILSAHIIIAKPLEPTSAIPF